VNTAIIINAAGCGSRLGLGIPKSLVKVGAQQILKWQLTTMCRSEDTVRIVVGYMAEQVAELAKFCFPTIKVIHNDDWQSTKTAASLSLGAANWNGRCVSLDGDLLVHPGDFRQLVESGWDTIGVTAVSSQEPVCAEVDESGMCRAISYDTKSPWEWTGLVNFDPRRVPPAKNHVFEMIQGILPAVAIDVRSVEVDTLEDLRNANFAWSRLLSLQNSHEGHRDGQAEDRPILAVSDINRRPSFGNQLPKRRAA
jgi:choline kinase